MTRGRHSNRAYVTLERADDHADPHPGDDPNATARSVLYGVLLSEDNALLMGSLLLFLALGTVMLATRRLDWYVLGSRPADSEA